MDGWGRVMDGWGRVITVSQWSKVGWGEATMQDLAVHVGLLGKRQVSVCVCVCLVTNIEADY